MNICISQIQELLVCVDASPFPGYFPSFQPFVFSGVYRQNSRLTIFKSFPLCHTLKIQVCPKKGISPIQSYCFRMGLEPEKSYSIGRGLAVLRPY